MRARLLATCAVLVVASLVCGAVLVGRARERWVALALLAVVVLPSCATMQRECYLRCERQHNVCLATGEGCGEAREGCAMECHR